MSHYEDLSDDSDADTLLTDAEDAADRQYRQQTTFGRDPLARQTKLLEFRAEHIVRRRRQRRRGGYLTDEEFDTEESINLAITPSESERKQLFSLFLVFCIVFFVIVCLVLYINVVSRM